MPEARGWRKGKRPTEPRQLAFIYLVVKERPRPRQVAFLPATKNIATVIITWTASLTGVTRLRPVGEQAGGEAKKRGGKQAAVAFRDAMLEWPDRAKVPAKLARPAS